MDTLPLFFDLKHRRVVLIGAGVVASRKAHLLSRAGAYLTVIAKHFCEQMQEVLKARHHTAIVGDYLTDKTLAEHLDGAALVVCASDNEALNIQVHADASAKGVFVNVVDCAHLCTFSFGAIVDRSPLMVAVGTSGAAPVLSRLVRTKIEALLRPDLGQLARLAGGFRQKVKEALPTLSQRRRFWEDVLDDDTPNALSSHADAADNLYLKKLEGALRRHMCQSVQGQVSLVGAGPGAPDLLSFLAVRLMQQADVVLYDALVSDAILDLCRRDSARVYVGKTCAHHSKSQDDINALMVSYALAGKQVVRLKGGDPFVFGRGGEELAACQSAGVPCQVVPAITAAGAAGALCGIPLTLRKVAHGVVYLTAHQGAIYPTDAPLDPKITRVFYMGLHVLEALCEHLTGRLDPHTPAALISRVSLPDMQIITAPLSALAALQTQVRLPAPALVIVGEVVRHCPHWQDNA